MTGPVFACGRERIALPSPTTPRVYAGKRLRCELAEHSGPWHYEFVGELEGPSPTAEWARWTDDTSPVFRVLPDCGAHNGLDGDCRRYCTLFAEHPPPCSWKIVDPPRVVSRWLADIGISWRE